MATRRPLILAVACASLCLESALAVLPSASAIADPSGAAPRAAANSSSATANPPAAPTTPPTPAAESTLLEPQQVTDYIRQTLAWYRRMQALAARPRFAQDVAARSRLLASALGVVRIAFQFGHAAAALLAPARSAAAENPSAPGSVSRLTAVSARIDARIAALRSQLAKLDASLERAPARERAALKSQRDGLRSALQLEQEVRSAVQDMLRFQSSTFALEARPTRGLAGEIEDLERTVPEVRASEARAAPVVRAAEEPPAQATLPAAESAGVQAESAGIITLVGEWIGLQSDDGRLDDAVAATRALADKLAELQAPLRQQARQLVRAGVTGSDSTDLAALGAAQRSLAAAAARFKQVASVLVPLGEQRLLLADVEGSLTQWTQSVDATQATIMRYLLTRAGFLILIIVVVLVVSEIWRRAAFRYLRDPRRRSQFQILRRVAVGVTLAAVIVFGLVSQIGSLATYVGFLTAGLAVALQNVILAIVGYFFLIGRFGVRIGDRITLAGVTGRVADIGLIRIYLLELAGEELRPTGRIIVLSNAVLFQPQALFKQIPGADYLWHTISLALAPAADVQAAQGRLRKAVDAVYERYRPALEKQHAAARHLVEFETPIPAPEVRVRYAEEGLKFEIRYPVQAEHAYLTDREMLQALRHALAEEPPLTVASSGEPALETSQA